MTSLGLNESWQVGTVHQIRWTHNLGAGARFAVDVSHDGGLTWQAISSRVGCTSSSFAWRVTSPSTDSAILRVRTTVGTSAFGLSPSFGIWNIE